MSRPVFLILTILCYFTLVQNVCIEQPGELPLNGIACVKTNNYTDDIQKLPKPSSEIILVFALSDIPTLVNHGFTPLADVVSHLLVARTGLKTIEDDAFAGLTKLQRLYLGDNELTEVKASWFRGLEKLESLHLKRNRIVQFDPNVFQHLPNLQELDVSMNRLRCFNVEHLKTLNATKTDVDRNPYDWICAVPILRWSKENGKELLFYDDAEKVANECYDSITDGPNKSKMLDDCISAKLDEALKNPELLGVPTSTASLVES